MADRREYSGRRNGSFYRTGSYYQRENTLRKSRSILPYQIFVCAVLLLCLLGGWLLDAQWFADGKRQLLVQINAQQEKKLQRANEKIADLEARAAKAEAEIRVYADSTSWRITAPFRKIIEKVKRNG